MKGGRFLAKKAAGANAQRGKSRLRKSQDAFTGRRGARRAWGGGVLSSFFTDAQDLSDFPCAFLFLNIPSPAGVLNKKPDNLPP